jgi:hypothetical protein
MEMQQIFMGREKPQMRIGEAWIDYRAWTEREKGNRSASMAH